MTIIYVESINVYIYYKKKAFYISKAKKIIKIKQKKLKTKKMTHMMFTSFLSIIFYILKD